ncbi:MAG: MFS transporter [Marmoricola sp.]
MLLAYLIFNTQEWANWIALLVWGFEKGGVHEASLIAVVQLVPAAVLAPAVATFQGKRRRGAALRLSYLVQALTQELLGVALLAGASFPVIAVVAAAYSVAITFTRPAHNALLPELSDTTGELAAGNAASGGVEAAATFLGPVISGLVVAAWSPGGLVLVMAGLTLLAVGSTARGLDIERPARVDAPPGPDPAGFREVLADPSAAVLALMVAAEYALIGMMDILLVVLAFDILEMSPSGPGMLNSAMGVGGLVGAGFTFMLIGRKSLTPALILGALSAGFALAIIGRLDVTALALLLIAVSGAGKLFFDVTCRTFLQRLLPDRLLTAVFGLTESLMMAGLAVGNLVAPLLVSLLGPRSAFLAAGSFLPVVALLAAARLRRMDSDTVIPEDVLALLRSVPALSVLTPRVIERLAIDATAVVAAAGTPVITEGEPGRLFYVIESGILAVSRGGQPIRGLGPGDWFGELALLRSVPRTATVTAVDEAHLWAVDRNAFLASVGATTGSLDAVAGHGQRHYI